MQTRKIIFCISIWLFFFLTNLCLAKETGFTQEDRERLIKVETTLKVFMEQIDKRFEQVDKRFEQIDRRFEQVDKRFSELREDINNRFDQMITFLWMLVGIFTTLTAVVIGFAYWDRRTIIRKARDETIEKIEREGRLSDLINAFRRLAQEDKKLAEVMKTFGLL